MKKVSVIGLFCTGRDVSDGQSIKTRILVQELEKSLSEDNVNRIDTYGWKRHPFKLFSKSITAVRKSENVIFMTDEGGIKIFPWLLLGANVLFHRRLHYVVIGGWLVPFLKKHKFLAACLKKFNMIFVETRSMHAGLGELGFSNVCLMPNFKNICPVEEKQLMMTHQEPYSFCTFSRVMKEKGIEDAVKAIESVNNKYGRTVCTLDIYGAIDSEQNEWFENLSATFSSAICYRGVAPYDQSVDILKNYFALLFPTSYIKEGIPGTIIDAYAAGLPVIASRWSGFVDMVDDGITGIGYPWLENERLEQIVEDVVLNPQRILDMKKNCLKKVAIYMPENGIEILLEHLS